MKKHENLICVVPIILIVFFIAFYIGMAAFYSNGFSYGTWINGIYCTGKNVEEVNELLKENNNYDGLKITDFNGKIVYLTKDNFKYDCDYSKHLNYFLMKQQPLLWGINLLFHKTYELEPTIVYNNDDFNEFFEGIPSVEKALKRTNENVRIMKSAKGYCLIDPKINVINQDKAKALLEATLDDGKTELNLVESDCFYNKDYTKNDLEVLDLWDKISKFQDTGIVYDMGDEKLELNGTYSWQFIKLNEDGSFALDENGNLILDENGVKNFISWLCSEYNTFDTKREFKSSRGDIVEIPGGTYGNELNEKAELEYLLEALKNGTKETHTPTYEKEAFVRGKNDIKDTYIEIDMTNQQMYVYQEGICIIDTPIVTGNMVRKMSTPVCACYVYAKQKNRVLKGPNYASKVNFWMPVKGNIGIHDAPWRKEYGGDIYLKNGSHGCINTPYDAMSEIYEKVEIGTPVVMFY